MPKSQWNKGDVINIIDLEVGMVVKLGSVIPGELLNGYDQFTDCLVTNRDDRERSVSFARPYAWVTQSGGLEQSCERWQAFYIHRGLNYVLVGWAK